MKLISALSVLLILPFCVKAQNGSTPKIVLEFGYSFRTTGLQGLRGIPLLPISWERNLSGSRGKVGLGYRIVPNIEVRYIAGIHYDHARAANPGNMEDYDWFLDHNFGVRYYPSKTGILSSYFILEVSRINSNAYVEYFFINEWRKYSLTFTAVGLGYGFRVWRLMLEPRISISDFGNPYNSGKRFTFISIDLLYRFALK